MTVLISDDFDRSGALGSNWSVQEGSFTLDGDRAGADAVPGTICRAVYTGGGTALESTAIGTYRKTECKLWFNGAGGGTVELGLIFRTGVAIAGGAFQEEFEFVWSSVTSGTLYLRRRSPFVGGPLIVDWSTALAWTSGTAKTFGVVWSLTAGGLVLQMYVDGTLVHQLGNPSYSFLTTVMRGIFGARTAATAGTQDASVPQFDLFRISDSTPVFNAETAPTVTADPALATIDISPSLVAPIVLTVPPTSVLPEDLMYATVQEAMESGHVVRWPAHSTSIRRVSLKWSGLNQSRLDTLRAFFSDTVVQALNRTTYVTPEGVLWDFVFDQPLTIRGTGYRMYEAETSALGALNND